jgi:hypothetical protein
MEDRWGNGGSGTEYLRVSTPRKLPSPQGVAHATQGVAHATQGVAHATQGVAHATQGVALG